MRLVAATLEWLEALQSDTAEFARLIGGPVPAGWPEFPESIEFTIDRLRERPDQAGWWMHFFFDSTTDSTDDSAGPLVGSGGFVGPPEDGVVEIGYEIAPEFRGRGLATAAATAMVARAVAEGDVHTVIAHTLAGPSASTSVLRRAGFVCMGEVPDSEEGTVWRWEWVEPSAR